MSERVIRYEVKLPKFVTVILAILAIGLWANVLVPLMEVSEAHASEYDVITAIENRISSAESNIISMVERRSEKETGLASLFKVHEAQKSKNDVITAIEAIENRISSAESNIISTIMIYSDR